MPHAVVDGPQPGVEVMEKVPSPLASIAALIDSGGSPTPNWMAAARNEVVSPTYAVTNFPSCAITGIQPAASRKTRTVVTVERRAATKSENLIRALFMCF